MADEKKKRRDEPRSRRPRSDRRTRRPRSRRPEAESARGDLRRRPTLPSREVSDTELPTSADVEAAAEPTPSQSRKLRAESRSRSLPRLPKKQRSRKHVPRTARRTRTKVVREKPATRKPITRTEKPEAELGRRQERRGVVVSDKGDKTIVVKVDVIKSHPKYKKVVRRTRQVPRARRGEHRRRRRHRPHRRDAAAVEDEALAPRRDRGEGAVDDPAGDTPQGRRQHGCS